MNQMITTCASLWPGTKRLLESSLFVQLTIFALHMGVGEGGGYYFRMMSYNYPKVFFLYRHVIYQLCNHPAS